MSERSRCGTLKQRSSGNARISKMKSRTGKGRPRSRLLVALLALALALTGVLAYQAATSEQSQRMAAQRALHDYASFAMWQLNQQASQELLSSMITTVIMPLTRV